VKVTVCKREGWRSKSFCDCLDGLSGEEKIYRERGGRERGREKKEL
jgi:hypothetical protein